MNLRPKQRRLHCLRGRRVKILARALCAVFYTLQRQDQVYLGGLHEQVLAPYGYQCRACHAPKRVKRSLVVHHRLTGVSTLAWLITLCPACHARVTRTRVLLKQWPEFLRTL